MFVVAVVVATEGSGLTLSRALGSTVTLLRPNGDASMGLDDQAKPVDPNSTKQLEKYENTYITCGGKFDKCEAQHT